MIPVKVLGIGFGTAAIAWMGLIFYLSSLSGAEASQGLESGTVSWLGDLRSYGAHIVLYAVLAALIQVGMEFKALITTGNCCSRAGATIRHIR